MTSELTTLTSTTLNAPTPTTDPEPSLLVGRGYWPRAGAYLIDNAFVVVVAYGSAAGVGILLGLLFGLLGQVPEPNMQAIEGLSTLFGFGTFVAYYVLCEWLGGATLGKLLLGLRVVRTDGSPCGLGATLLRTVIRPFDGFFLGLPARLSMREPRNQRLGDRAAGTLVVDARSPHLLEPRPTWALPLAVALWAAGQFLAIALLMLLALAA